MRMILPLSTLILFGLGGCAAECPTADSSNGAYAVFSNLITAPELTNAEEYPSYLSPVNGDTLWEIAWNSATAGAVLVSLDGQPYEATGLWEPIECGGFSLDFQGDYLSEADTEHAFVASAQLVVFDDALEGTWSWSEIWTNSARQSGTLSGVAQLRGVKTE